MPLDAICLRAVLHELRPQLIGARIDKVQQPARDQIVLLLRGNLRLHPLCFCTLPIRRLECGYFS